MKDYKRLTERDDSLCIDCVDIGFCRKTCISQARYERLQFLENEIESGELISTVQSEQGEQEIAYFVKHNAAVRKQAVIEFAVRLKKKADSYNYEKSYINRSVMYTDIDDLVTEVCGK